MLPEKMKRPVMAILCLLLGFISISGSSSTVNPSTSVTTLKATTVAHSQITTTMAGGVVATTTPVTSTLAKTDSPIITSPTAATIASPTGALPTPSRSTVNQGAPSIGPSSINPHVSITSSTENPSTTIKQATTAAAMTSATKNSASTAAHSMTSPIGSSKSPKASEQTGPSQVSTTIKAGTISTASHFPNSTVTEVPTRSLTSEPPKDTNISTPAVSSSASPQSTTTEGDIPKPMTVKSTIPNIPSSSSSVPTTAIEVSTSGKNTSQETIETNKVKQLKDNIEVNCTNRGNLMSYVRIAISSAICDNNGKHTDDKQLADSMYEITMPLCKALKPGYQGDQDKCIIHLARINENHLAITAAFVESHFQPKELYTQLKRNGANMTWYRYDGADPEDEDVVSIPLISAIVSLAVLLLIIAAAYGCWHQRKARKREQRLTEELQTMENGYHDNPTLEVMETSPEMQEKKGGPNGELGDSWIVPLDNLTREDLEEEEDTHL